MSQKVRFTISVDAEVHAAFVQMAEVAGQSLSTCVGDWLRDTTESARFVTAKMRELRLAPTEALVELAGVQESAARETRELAQRVARQGVARGGAGREPRERAAPARAEPPCSPTGVNTPGKPGRRP